MTPNPAVGRVLTDHLDEIKLRNLIISGPMDEIMASGVVKQLLTFEAEDPGIPICLYTNTYGGSVLDMLGMYDVMNFIKSPVYTVGFGKVMSAGVLILAAGEKGHRYCLPNTSIMIHKVKGGGFGNATDLKSSAEYIEYLQEKSKKLLVKHTKLSNASVKRLMTDSDVYLTPKQALDVGIIDKISAVQPKAIC